VTGNARRGVISCGVHLPRHLLDRQAIRAALGEGGGKGTRTVAGFDEDTTSMGVEAARAALASATATPASVQFATTAPAYADKTNATAIHAALGLSREVFVCDHVGSARGAVGSLRAALAEGGLAVLSDIRIGRPGSADEARGGDGAAAILFGTGDDVVAEVIGSASVTEEFLDRWRVPGEVASSVWEERFGQGHYVALIRCAVSDALRAAGVESADHVVISSLHARAAKAAAAGFGEAAVDAVEPVAGHLGAAHLGVRLTEILDRAHPGETILLVSAVDGADAIVLRVTEAVTGRAPSGPLTHLKKAAPVDYSKYLTWRGLLHREPPRRPDPLRYDAPPAARAGKWKYAFHGSRCLNCKRVHLPPQRVCVECHAVDSMESVPLADVPGTVATFSVDHLAYSLSPPTISAVIDFDGGGRFSCELTDCTPDDVEMGLRVEMTFRRMYSANGVHNYFWKARPSGQ